MVVAALLWFARNPAGKVFILEKKKRAESFGMEKCPEWKKEDFTCELVYKNWKTFVHILGTLRFIRIVATVDISWAVPTTP